VVSFWKQLFFEAAIKGCVCGITQKPALVEPTHHTLQFNTKWYENDHIRFTWFGVCLYSRYQSMTQTWCKWDICTSVGNCTFLL